MSLNKNYTSKPIVKHTILSNDDLLKKIRIVTLVVSIGLLLVSLTQKSYCQQGSCGDAIAALLFGPLGIGMKGGEACLTWLANPLILVSWLTLKKRPRVALVLSALATGTALSFLCFDSIVATEAGHVWPITGYRAGYWLWVASMASLVLGSIFYFMKIKNGPKPSDNRL